MKKHYKIILNWLYVFIWMGVIYYFSSQPNLQSSLAPIWDLVFRKGAHITEYFILAFLVFNATWFSKISLIKILLVAGFISLAYSFLDEWHQGFVIGRNPSIMDVGTDLIGILAFILLRLRQEKNN